MPARSTAPNRVHLLAHANPVAKDVRRFGFRSTAAYTDFIASNLPDPLRITWSKRVFAAIEDQSHGGRRDDAERVRDLQNALDDPHTVAIVALSGGAYFTRILPHFDFRRFERFRTPLLTMGFSEMTSWVNLLSTYPRAAAYYWLCPNYLAWKIKPAAAAREAFGWFWKNTLPAMLAQHGAALANSADSAFLDPQPIRAALVSGRCKSGKVRVIGGCLSVLAAALAGPLARRLKPDGRWLALEDVNEAPYRVDRCLAFLKLSGWFDKLAGVLVGDFHSSDTREAQQSHVVELLKHHVPPKRKLPIAVTKDIGHVWPMQPLLINRPIELHASRRGIELG